MKINRIMLILLAVFLPLAGIAQETKSSTILILDASASMWGQIGGKPKIEIARNTAEDIIKNRPSGLEMGFMTYGHRRKGDCKDIELIVPPGTETTEKLLGALKLLVPKGKTPIYDSVLKAAESLKYTEQAASIILVSDGIETCGGDLNALGKILAEQGIDFKTHIIGFAMSDADTVDLRGLAKATGGTYSDAGDAAQLKLALQSAMTAAVKPPTTLTLVPLGEDGKSVLRNGVEFGLYKGKSSEDPAYQGSGGQFITEVEPGSYTATATFGGKTLEAKISAKKASNTTHTFKFVAPILSLQALLKEGGEPIESSVSWEIQGPPNSEGKRRQVGYSYDAQPKMRLAPGEYLVVARRGSARVEKAITFSDQAQTLSLIFGAGNLKMSAVLVEGADPTKGGLSWEVQSEPDAEGNRKKITYSYDDQPGWTLPVGSYLVTVRKSSASASIQIQIKAGELTTGRIVMGSGILAPQMVMSSGMEAHTGLGLSWDVFGEANAEGERPKITYSYDAQPSWTIPTGSYTVTVSRGSATASQDIEITSGKKTEITLNLNAALLSAKVVMSKGGEGYAGTGLNWDVFGEANAEGERPKITYSYDAQPSWTVPTGSYTVKVSRGSATGQQDVKVIAGKLNTLTIDLNAGLVKVILADSNGTPLNPGKTSWDVFGKANAKGERPKITYSYDKVPTFILPTGSYLFKVEYDGKKASVEATVPAGKLTEFTIKVKE